MSLSWDDRLKHAARRLVQAQDKAFTSEDRKMLEIWLEEDPDNRKAFEQMRDVWEHLGVVEPDFSPEKKYAHRAELTHQREAERKTSLKALFNLFFKPNKKLAAAFISLAILVIFCLPVIKMHLVEPVETFYSYNTATGEQKTVTLSDGSILKMNVSSSISVCMSKGYRRVEMNNGEVFFTVKPDSERPFEVRTSKGLVRVLGTAFNVKTRKDMVAVDVDHGKVQVQNAPNGPGDMRVKALTLLSGQGADIDATGRLAPVRTSNIQQVLAWQQHQVVFKNTPLSSVLQELALYHKVNIKLALEDLGKKRVTGTFDMHNLEQTLKIIATAASLQMEKNINGTITLSGEPVVKSRS
ncbi:FecR domain-containing protein [uncultured Desulfobacter sp.]|uniref:FecR family protein n=1 Tax=uncultured Desulfobacter sp. TaxID=240139 RepID=UPI0029F4E684|nr:FecR domain-containing protein [uncultured Desulfobacter sp.]